MFSLPHDAADILCAYSAMTDFDSNLNKKKLKKKLDVHKADYFSYIKTEQTNIRAQNQTDAEGNVTVVYESYTAVSYSVQYIGDESVIDLSPINFLLRSAREQRSIIYSFASYLKISPAKMQFKVLTKKADVNRHLYKIEEEIARETDEKCRALQMDYADLVRNLGSREAITRRFFIIFEYEGATGRRGKLLSVYLI